MKHLNHDHRVLFNPKIGSGAVYAIDTGATLESAIAVAAAIAKTTDLLADSISTRIEIQEYIDDEWTVYTDEFVNAEINIYLKTRVKNI